MAYIWGGDPILTHHLLTSHWDPILQVGSVLRDNPSYRVLKGKKVGDADHLLPNGFPYSVVVSELYEGGNIHPLTSTGIPSSKDRGQPKLFILSIKASNPFLDDDPSVVPGEELYVYTYKKIHTSMYRYNINK